ncbi:MAG TPA: dihydrofolate reductase [Kofleriaceae bacterium]|nr:dihydrofolate reductase [Kofleriaceae bacterium]
MKLLVCGEGTSEIGRPEQAGVVETLVRRCLETDAQRLAFEVVKVSQLPKDRAQAGEARRARQAIDEARRRQCDGFIYVRDADGHHAERRRQLEDALSSLEMAHVIGIAIETLEAWLMSDPDAIQDVLRQAVTVPAKPESLWGRPGGPGHPKFEWNQLCREARYDSGLSTMAAVAERLSIDRARAACPEGFARFHDQLLRAFPAFDVVVAADQALGIGQGGELPWPKLKGDLAHVRAVLDEAPAGKRSAIIMGRRTWETKEVGQKPSPRRLSVVVSRKSLEVPEGVITARSLTEALYRASVHEDIDRVLVVGGAQLFRDALAHPRLRFAYLTRIAQTFECDAHLPGLEHLVPDAAWTSEAAGHHEDMGFEYTIERLKRP